MKRFAVFVCASVALSFAVIYGGASALSGLIPWRIRVDLPFESSIPFVPWSAVVYLSMDLLLLLAPLVLKDARRLAAFGALLIVQMLIAAPFFVLLPVADVFPPRIVTGAAAPFFALADTMNLERNYLPSLHVAFSVTAARTYGGRGWWLWALAIAASTLLMHEHYVVDVLAGAALALVVYSQFFERLVAFDLHEALTTEWLLFTDLTRFGLRHRRYVPINLALYALALPRFRERRVLRSGYVLLQVIDDVLDGDRVIAEPPLDFAARAAQQLQTRTFSNDRLGRLCEAFCRDAPVEAVPVAISLIHTMCRDHQRMTARERWDEARIREQLRSTFRGSLEVLLICGGSTARASDVPKLVELLSWCSAVRDLDEDETRGLFNMPSGATRSEWLRSESARARQLLSETDAELSRLSDQRTAKWLGVLARSTRKYLTAQ
ncbi:MAG: phosphatase PAP2 family protein [Archangium sp.]